jgi:hypothetical protein
VNNLFESRKLKALLPYFNGWRKISVHSCKQQMIILRWSNKGLLNSTFQHWRIGSEHIKSERLRQCIWQWQLVVVKAHRDLEFCHVNDKNMHISEQIYKIHQQKRQTRSMGEWRRVAEEALCTLGWVASKAQAEEKRVAYECMGEWRRVAEEARKEAFCMLLSAFEEWRAHTVEKKQIKNKTRKVMQRCTNGCLFSAFKEWRRVAEEALRIRMGGWRRVADKALRIRRREEQFQLDLVNKYRKDPIWLFFCFVMACIAVHEYWVPNNNFLQCIVFCVISWMYGLGKMTMKRGSS